MNTLKKVGLTALGTSLIASSAFAASLDVTGGASITLANQDKVDKGNGFTMSDEVTFSGTGELDNGFTVTTSFQLDSNETTTGNMDNRSITVNMNEAGTFTFSGHGGDSALSAVDDVMPHADGNETWDTIAKSTNGTAKFGSISGNTVENMMSYSNSSLMDGLTITASLAPSDGTNLESTNSFALAYTGVDGLTVGYATDENSEAGTAQTDFDTMYAKYAYGPVTVGYQKSESDGALAADQDEFVAYGISYAVNDNLTVSYNESAYDDGAKTVDQENTAFDVSYTMGSISFVGTMVQMDNVGGSTSAIDDVEGYELGVSFAF